MPWAAAGILAAGVVTGRPCRLSSRSENPLADAMFTPFTNWEGSEEGAEISPNGELVAFLSDRDGEFNLWVSQVGTGLFHNLTPDYPALAASGSIVRKLGFSADSAQIWFNPGDGKPPHDHAVDRRAAAAAAAGRHEHASMVAGRPKPRVRRQGQPRRSDLSGRRHGSGGAANLPGRAPQERESCLVTRQPVDLLRARTGAAGRNGDGRMAASSVGRDDGAGHVAAPGHQFPRTARIRDGCCTWLARRIGPAPGSGPSMPRAAAQRE